MGILVVVHPPGGRAVAPLHALVILTERNSIEEGSDMGGRQSSKSPRGNIGEQIFAEVEQLTADGKTKRLAAFKVLAERSGRALGTVAANYYRVARKRGALMRVGRPRGSAGGGRSSATIAAALKALQAAIVAQEKEMAALRQENQRFQQLRRLLKA
ncbi:MAG: hypothetical protein ACREJO_18315 [Phycisphaerales bacterium]